MAIKSFKKLVLQAKLRDSYWVEKAKLDFSIALNQFFERSGKTQKELASKLNTSPAYITKVFRGDANFTIETMVKLARAVDGQLHIDIAPQKLKNYQPTPLESANRAILIYCGNSTDSFRPVNPTNLPKTNSVNTATC
ncbi:helix-turn-helix domain-containing protein [Methylomonas sp. MS20]|uniref:helix-turn-helix domain-containing protein n=1 Tax=unclassified Methylomonas TaxID=2608980 RepID=UPI0028A4A03A|nr:helix-turn-helix transcriptional regulator [Methylomonas sp. MV1]MDT4331077.1 helix-turn-helix transcriptional regulator [Methylomonas sp. MV1]